MADPDTIRGPIAFFDADETLLDLKSMLAFEAFYEGERPTIDPDRPRSEQNLLFWRRYRGRPVPRVRAVVVRWFVHLRAHLGDAIYRECARAELERLQGQGFATVMVSGSTPLLLEPFAAELGIDHVVGTDLELEDGRFTGRVVGPVRTGDGKAAAVNDLCRAWGVDPRACLACGDHPSDLPMLEAVGQACIVPGNESMEALARARGWRVLGTNAVPTAARETPSSTLEVS
ncbi:MAG: HAD-IB family hydrolase [Acidobacteriota bacterium]